MSFFFGSSFLGALVGCRPDEEILDPGFKGGLTFSTDTLRFDTLFSTVGSTSKRIQAFNASNNALNISHISLGMGQQSPYSITVNGIKAKSVTDQLILGGDSLLILVEVRVDPKDEDLPYLVKDSIVFETNGVLQDIKLVSWGQDAIFLGDEILDCNTTWTAERPIVLYKSVLVDSLCELNVLAGARIYASFNAFLYVRGSIRAHGTASQRILFRNDRLEPIFEYAPGQWGGIFFLEGTGNNQLDFVTIKNAQYGVRLGAPDSDTIPDLILRNTVIENMSRSGIISFSSDLYAVNTLVDNCKDFTVANIGGGNYTYDHCTFSNNGFTFFRENPSFAITDNIPLDNGQIITENVFLSAINTIIHGNLSEEILINNNGGATIELLVAHSMLTTQMNEFNGNNNILNDDPRFINPFNYNYRLDTLSPAKDTGLNLGILYDLDSALRDDQPDIGAYERIE